MASRIVNLSIQLEVSDDENNAELAEKLDNLLADMEDLANQNNFDIYNTLWEDL
ncbi:MAG: hypothetical protein SVO01_00600 [Thermotogota bacterium]|nr:hypothetical protein [Thermotogota bacterium]